MKATVTLQKEVDIVLVGIEVAVRYGDEDMPYDFPFRKGEMWEVVVDMDSGKILDWPEGVEHELHMKVCDCGIYRLMDADRRVIGSIEQNYVPHGVVPGDYGDYIILDIKGDGTIANWPKSPDVSAFFQIEG